MIHALFVLALVGVAAYWILRQGWGSQVLFLLGAVGSLCFAGFCAGFGIALLIDKGDGNDLAGIVLLAAAAVLTLTWAAFWKQVFSRNEEQLV